MTDTPTPASKPSKFEQRAQAELYARILKQQPGRRRAPSFMEGAEWGAREVLSAPVSDAVLEAYYDARTVPGCDECEQRERAGVAQGLRPCERHRIAAAIKAIAAEMGVATE